MEHNKRTKDIANFVAGMQILDNKLNEGIITASGYYTRYQTLYAHFEFHKYVQDFPEWAPNEVRAKLTQNGSVMLGEIHTPLTEQSTDYQSLTKIARANSSEAPSYVIQSWMRNKNTVELLHLWETRNNPNYISQGYEDLRRRQSQGPFTLTLKYWITNTNAIGIVSRRGKGGGTYAHPTIACDFIMWISPEYKLCILETLLMPNEFIT